MIDSIFFLWGRAIMICGFLSLLYKRNIITDILEYGIIGITAATSVMSSIESLQKGVITAIQGGELSYIMSIVIGLMYLTFFVRRIAILFRLALLLTIALQLGISAPLYTKSIYGLGASAALAIGTLGGAFIFITFICCLTYFVFSKKIATGLAIPRKVAIYCIYSYCGLQIAANYFYSIDDPIASVATWISSSAIIVPIVFGVWILIDLWRQGKIPGLPKIPVGAK